MPFHKILVPVDMSPHSRAALELAGELVQRTGGTIHLLNAYGLREGESAYRASMSPQVEAQVASNSERELSEWAKRFAPAGVKMRVSPQEPRYAILEAAEELDADLIVMGTHGRTGIKHLLMGSIAEFVVRSAPCPVLTVGQPAK